MIFSSFSDISGNLLLIPSVAAPALDDTAWQKTVVSLQLSHNLTLLRCLRPLGKVQALHFANSGAEGSNQPHAIFDLAAARFHHPSF